MTFTFVFVAIFFVDDNLVTMRDKLSDMKHKCMSEAKKGLEKTTFHAIPWILEEIHWISKVYFGYFVLLNYSYKSWSIIKTRDRFEIC